MSYQSIKKTWRKLKCISLNKSQSEKITYRRIPIPILYHSGKDETMDIVKRLVVARFWGEG